jgi:hypothetical protein
MRVLATITHPETIRRILGHLGVRAEPLARAPAVVHDLPGNEHAPEQKPELTRVQLDGQLPLEHGLPLARRDPCLVEDVVAKFRG